MPVTREEAFIRMCTVMSDGFSWENASERFKARTQEIIDDEQAYNDFMLHLSCILPFNAETSIDNFGVNETIVYYRDLADLLLNKASLEPSNYGMAYRKDETVYNDKTSYPARLNEAYQLALFRALEKTQKLRCIALMNGNTLDNHQAAAYVLNIINSNPGLGFIALKNYRFNDFDATNLAAMIRVNINLTVIELEDSGMSAHSNALIQQAVQEAAAPTIKVTIDGLVYEKIVAPAQFVSSGRWPPQDANDNSSTSTLSYRGAQP